MAIIVLRPNRSGRQTDIGHQFPNYGEHWDKVCDIIPDGLKTFIMTMELNKWVTDLFHIEPCFINEGIINNVTIFVRCFCEQSNDKKNMRIAIMPIYEAMAYHICESPDLNLPYIHKTDSYKWLTNPDITYGGVRNWTWDDLPDLLIGVSLRAVKFDDGGNAYCTQVYAEIDYTPPTPTPTPPTPTPTPPTPTPIVSKIHGCRSLNNSHQFGGSPGAAEGIFYDRRQ